MLKVLCYSLLLCSFAAMATQTTLTQGLPLTSLQQHTNKHIDWSKKENWVLATQQKNISNEKRKELLYCESVERRRCRFGGSGAAPDLLNTATDFLNPKNQLICQQQIDFCQQQVEHTAQESRKQLYQTVTATRLSSLSHNTDEDLRLTDDSLDLLELYQQLNDKSKVPEFLKAPADPSQ